ncbi:hypothetical protein [Rhizobium herbae]|uniref:O-antigen ligase domain-containing protein n=1 Tax=Rhizobium herbae TaxID=508661 RepID=A0ABS4ERW3_9HYPH|nr:hypothetical protein [Rhizobium herbae]MBP1860673.1 hypothetical protein [Rhizobium herbae]
MELSSIHGHHAPQKLGGNSDALMYAVPSTSSLGASFLFLAVFLQFIQILLFYFIPLEARYTLAGMTVFSLAICCILIKNYRYDVNLVFLSVALMFLCWIISKIFVNSEFKINFAMQQLSIPLWLLAAKSYTLQKYQSKIRIILYVILFFACFMMLTGDSYTVGGIERPANFIDIGGPHLSAYIALGIYIYLSSDRTDKKSNILHLLSIITLIYIIYTYQVRTIYLAIFAYFLITLIKKTSLSKSAISFAFFEIIVFSAAIALVVSVSTDLNQFSSGRTDVYIERLNQISQKSLVELFFGSGPGSDLIVSDQWWWDAKNSHNDFLTILYERGLVGVIGVILLFVGMAKGRSAETIAITSAVFIASAISNGLMSRPLAFFLFALALSLDSALQPSALPRASSAPARSEN